MEGSYATEWNDTAKQNDAAKQSDNRYLQCAVYFVDAYWPVLGLILLHCEFHRKRHNLTFRRMESFTPEYTRLIVKLRFKRVVSTETGIFFAVPISYFNFSLIWKSSGLPGLSPDFSWYVYRKDSISYFIAPEKKFSFSFCLRVIFFIQGRLGYFSQVDMRS